MKDVSDIEIRSVMYYYIENPLPFEKIIEKYEEYIEAWGW
jgi:hypothetical protein